MRRRMHHVPHLGCAYAVPTNVDHVVYPPDDPEVAVRIPPRAIPWMDTCACTRVRACLCASEQPRGCRLPHAQPHLHALAYLQVRECRRRLLSHLRVCTGLQKHIQLAHTS